MITINNNNRRYRFYNAIYTASASATDSNVTQIFNDDFNGNILGVMTWVSTGNYSFECTRPMFAQNLSSMFFSAQLKASTTIQIHLQWEWKSTSQILIKTYNGSGTLINAGFNLNLEYRLYNSYVFSNYPN